MLRTRHNEPLADLTRRRDQVVHSPGTQKKTPPGLVEGTKRESREAAITAATRLPREPIDSDVEGRRSIRCRQATPSVQAALLAYIHCKGVEPSCNGIRPTVASEAEPGGGGEAVRELDNGPAGHSPSQTRSPKQQARLSSPHLERQLSSKDPPIPAPASRPHRSTSRA